MLMCYIDKLPIALSYLDVEKPFPHYDLGTVLRSESFLVNRTVGADGKVAFKPTFNINGQSCTLRNRMFVFVWDERLFGKRIRFSVGIDEHRLFRFYLREVMDHPEIPINRFVPFKVRDTDVHQSEGTRHPKLCTLGRSVDDPHWSAAEDWRDTMATIDALYI